MDTLSIFQSLDDNRIKRAKRYMQLNRNISLKEILLDEVYESCLDLLKDGPRYETELAREIIRLNPTFRMYHEWHACRLDEVAGFVRELAINGRLKKENNQYLPN